MLTLVTGLEGFTGQYLERELKAHGHTVVGLKSDITDTDSLTDEIKIIQPDYVVHLAAIAFVGHGNASDFYTVNLIGTRNLLEALSIHSPNIKGILLASSANVYGNNPKPAALTEDLYPAPANDYAVSKMAMEEMAQLWSLPIFIVRPFNYTGVGQSEQFLIPKIVSHFRAKKNVIELGSLDVSREFGDVRNVVEIYRKLLVTKPIGGTFNVCTGIPYSLKEVISMCEKITNHQIEIQVNPLFVRKNEVSILSGDNTQLKSIAPDWHPRCLEETLTWMLLQAPN